MICCLDVDYRVSQGHCSAVLFKDWADTTPVKVYSSVTDPIAAYEPGAFYKRELPCMLNTLQLVEEKITTLMLWCIWYNLVK